MSRNVGSVEINQIIDLERYPVDQPDHPGYQELLSDGRAALDEVALFSMAGFIQADVVPQMARELEQLVPVSCRYEQMRNAYTYGFDEPGRANGHPHDRLHKCAYNQVLNYQIPNDSPLRQVYYWQPLTEFLRLLCGYDSFYRSDCPHLALTAKIAGEGDTDGWHYDSNDVVFSILLQAPQEGGVFEYAPYIRSETDENYPAVASLLDDTDSFADRPVMAPGNLTVFKGDLSMHRVSPVTGKRKRIVGLFCYDSKPGTSFDQWYISQLQQGLPS